MNAEGIIEQARIPIHIENIKETQYTLIVNPKHAVIKHSSTVWVEIQGLFQVRGPMKAIKLRVVTAPSNIRPGVLEL